MLTLTIDRKSWHYRIACFFNNEDRVRRKKDSCSYIWSVIFGTIRLAIVTALFLLLFVWPIDIVITHLVSPKYYGDGATSFGFGALIAYGIAVLVLAFITTVGQVRAHMIELREARIAEAKQAGTWEDPAERERELARIRIAKRKERARRREENPSFIRLAYRSLKGRFCMKVHFE